MLTDKKWSSTAMLSAQKGRRPKIGPAKLSRVAYRIAIPALVLIVWMISSRLGLVPEYLLPSAQRVFFDTLPAELMKGDILLDAAQSIRRVMLGIALATITAVPIGLFLGYWSGVGPWVNPLLNAARVLPPASLVPLAVIWFGIGDSPALFLIWFTAFWPILMNSAVGVQNVERIYREGALTLGANHRQIMTTVLLPGALPQVAAGVRLAFGLGWSVVVTSELLAVRNGLGFYIWNARLMFSMDQVFVGILIIAIAGIILDTLLRIAMRNMFRWQESITIRN